MRRLSLALFTAFGLTAAAAPTQTLAQSLTVPTGQASQIGLGGAVRDVVVGDPRIADVSVINERTLVVMGKQPGVTTLMAFDAAGKALTSRQIVVSGDGPAAVTVYRGVTSAFSYACDSECSRIVPPRSFN